MADFINTTTSKSAVRELRYPIATLAAFDAIISGVVATNPGIVFRISSEEKPSPELAFQSSPIPERCCIRMIWEK